MSPKPTPLKILVVVVTYNAMKEWKSISFEEFLGASKDGYCSFDVWVTDNASNDGTAEFLTQYVDQLEHLDLSYTNIGFGMANNRALEYAIAKGYNGVLLINQDAKISTASATALVQYSARHPELGVLSPIHLNRENQVEDGFAHYSRLPKEYYLQHSLQRYSKTEEEKHIPLSFINAAIWYIPIKTLLRVGLFSNLFYHYGEDKDYCNRVLSKGYEVAYLPNVFAYHFRSADGDISLEKKMYLEQVYHLSEWINPNYSRLKGYLKGPLAFLLKKEHLFNTYHLSLYKQLINERKRVRLWRHAPLPDVNAIIRTLPGSQSCSPVVLFVYNRFFHTQKLLRSLQAQAEARYTNLIIFSDAAKGDKDREEVTKVRDLIKNVKGFASVEIHYNETNKGLAGNVIEGVTKVLETYPSAIILEDDLYLAPYFLRWMNDAIRVYKNKSNVAHIYACNYFYQDTHNKEDLFLYFAGSWGWATWRDRWIQLSHWDGTSLYKQLIQKDDKKQFDFDGSYPYIKMLYRQVKGEISSWAIRWNASLFLNKKLTCIASKSLVNNSGLDGSGTHCNKFKGLYNSSLVPYPIYTNLSTPIEENPIAYNKLKWYYRMTNNKMAKAIRKISSILEKRKLS